MEEFPSTYEKVLNKMYAEGKIKSLSPEVSAKIDKELEDGFKKIRQDYELKAKNSEAFMRGKMIS